MHDAQLWDVNDLPTARSGATTIVGIFEVHEVAFVEQTDLLDDGPSDQNAGKADPVHASGDSAAGRGTSYLWNRRVMGPEQAASSSSLIG